MSNWKEALKLGFEAPKPVKKQEFLQGYEPRKYGQPPIGMIEILFTQIGYIRKSVWISACMLLGMAAVALSNLQADTVWLLAALTPFLALIAILESSRSGRYQMAELEAVTRFSLRSILFARMLVIGLFDMLVLLVTVLLVARYTAYGIFLTGAYLLFPYLLTMLGGLLIERTPYGRENPYVSAFLAALISVSMMMLRQENARILRPVYGIYWELATVVLFAAIMVVFQKMMKELEEYTWN